MIVNLTFTDKEIDLIRDRLERRASYLRDQGGWDERARALEDLVAKLRRFDGATVVHARAKPW